VTGRLLRKYFSSRDDYVLATKVYFPMGSGVALAWLLDRPAVAGPIVGATKPHHLEEAIAALDVALNELDRAQLESPYRPHPVLGHS